MQNKKVTMLAAVLAVTVIAMAGVGYAITYTATTTNTGNYMDKTYVTVDQTGENSAYGKNFLTDLYFNTVNGDAPAVFTYTPVFTGKLTDANYDDSVEVKDDWNAALISKPLSLNVTPKNVEAETTGKLIVTVSNSDNLTVPLALDTGLTYVMVVAGNGYAQAAPYTANQWKFESLPVDAAASYTVSLYVKCEGTLNAAATGFATGAEDITSVFKFSIEVGQN